MTAAVFPFPLARRCAMIERQVRRCAEMNPSAAERHIEFQLDLQASAMRRKGIDGSLIEPELKAMERAIRGLLMGRATGGVR